MRPADAPVGCGIGWRHPHQRELLERRPPLPFIEVHAENYFGDGGAALALLDAAREHYPLSVHAVGLGLGSASGLDPWHLERLARLVERSQPWLVSDHACFGRAFGPAGLQHGGDLLPIPFDDAHLDLLVEAVERVQQRLARPIAVENLSAYLRHDTDHLAEPEFFRALCRRSGCLLLLDLNNLLVNARNRGAADPLADCLDWVRRVDAGTVAEVHLAGHAWVDGLAIDDHGSAVSEPLWALYRDSLALIGPRPTLIEWDSAIPPLQVLLDEAARADAVCAA